MTKKEKIIGKVSSKPDYIYNIILPFFSPGFCEGVVEIIKDNNGVVIFVNNEISKNKIEAIIDSDFEPERNFIKVEVDKI